MSEKKFIMTIAGKQIECGGSIPSDAHEYASTGFPDTSGHAIFDCKPGLFGRGQYVTNEGKTIDFDRLVIAHIAQMMLNGELKSLNIEKTWIENE